MNRSSLIPAYGPLTASTKNDDITDAAADVNRSAPRYRTGSYRGNAGRSDGVTTWYLMEPQARADRAERLSRSVNAVLVNPNNLPAGWAFMKRSGNQKHYRWHQQDAFSRRIDQPLWPPPHVLGVYVRHVHHVANDDICPRAFGRLLRLRPSRQQRFGVHRQRPEHRSARPTALARAAGAADTKAA